MVKKGFMIYLHDYVYDLAKQKAELQGISLSQVIENLLRSYSDFNEIDGTTELENQLKELQSAQIQAQTKAAAIQQQLDSLEKKKRQEEGEVIDDPDSLLI